MNKNQIVHAHWRHNETGTVIYITQKAALPQTFNYDREDARAVGGKAKGFIGKSELKTNWTRIES